jgi:hypothetical protein
LFQAGFAGLADLFAAFFVLVVGGDVADLCVESDAVVVLADDGELGAQSGGCRRTTSRVGAGTT